MTSCSFVHQVQAAVVTEALVPLDKRDLFKEGAIALEALSETTNGDADIVVMKSTCQSPKFFKAQSTADSADEKSGLALHHYREQIAFASWQWLPKESRFVDGHLFLYFVYRGDPFDPLPQATEPSLAWDPCAPVIASAKGFTRSKLILCFARLRASLRATGASTATAKGARSKGIMWAKKANYECPAA